MFTTKVKIMDKVTFQVSDLELELSKALDMEKYVKFMMDNRNVLNILEMRVYRYTKRYGAETLFIYDRHDHICMNNVTKMVWSVYDDPFLGY